MTTLATLLLLSCVFAHGARAQSGAPNAFVAVTPGIGFIASTYKQNAFQIRNDSTGTLRISAVSIYLKTAFLPDMVYDPVGLAGDVVAKCLEPNDGAVETGWIAPRDPCMSPFSSFHDDGYDRITVAFTDFDPGERFTFAVDADPTSIRGATGSGAAGSVSGLELTGANVTVHFDDGQTFAGRLFHQIGFDGGAIVIVKPAPPAAPAIDALAIEEPAATGDASQTIRITGQAGRAVRLLRVEAALVLEAAEGFDIDAFEGNEAVAVRESNAVIGDAGFVDVPVTLTRQSNVGGLNYFIAAVVDPDGSGRTGLTSNVVVLKLGQSCVHSAAAAECDDGDRCTHADACHGGSCIGVSYCGVPSSHEATPTLADALYILKAAVRSVDCDPCECDVDHNGSVTVLDALRDLQAIVGLPVELTCVDVGTPSTSTPSTSTTSTSAGSLPPTTAAP